MAESWRPKALEARLLVLLEGVTPKILAHLSPRSASSSASVFVGWRHAAENALESAYENEFMQAFPGSAVQGQVVRLLGCPAKPARLALAWRKRATSRAQKWAMLQGFENRAIAAARLEGFDVFAACKRAVLLCEEEPAGSEETEAEKEKWMNHIVEAVESGRFEFSIPGWEWLATRGILQDESVRWILELAHSLSSLRDVAPLLSKYPALLEHVGIYAVQLKEDPRLGHYGSELAIKERDVRRLLDRVNRRMF